MKFFNYLFVASILVLVSCSEGDDSENASAEEIVHKAGSGTAVSIDIPDGMYSLTKVKPNIVWTAKKISGSGHNGTISAVNGKFKVEGGGIVRGGLSLDMNTFTCTDLEGEDKQYFDEHIKSADFLDVEQFPTSEIKITGVKAKEDGLYANIHLQLHGGVVEYTSPVIFKAFELENGTQAYSISGEFFVDRTKHKIIYGSGSFFDNLGDKAINDEVLIKFTFTAV